MARLFFSLLLCVLVTSCKVVNVFPIDYLQPADVTFPESIKSVLVVDNTLHQSKIDSFERKRIDEGKVWVQEIGMIECDSKTTTESFAQNIADGNYFDEVLICDSSLRKNDHFVRETKLSQREVNDLASEFLVDMIFSLENANMYLEKKTFYMPDYPLPYTGVEAKVQIMLRIYLPARSEPWLTITDVDSLHWVIQKRDIDKQIIQEVSEKAATIPIKYLIPTWKTSERLYYASGCLELRDAAVAVKENSWEEALQLWMQANSKKSEKLQIYSAFNIALYYEMHDKFDEAVVWLEKAFDKVDKKQKKDEKGKVISPSEDYLIMTFYKIALEDRIKEKKKLDLQMARFKSNF